MLRDYITDLTAALQRLDLNAVEQLARLLHRARVEGRTVFCLGNGGSAATASHLAADWSKLIAPEGMRRLRCMSLTDNVPALTAAGNDVAYENVFVEQLRTFLRTGDVVVGLSTSGRSKNILNAFRYALDHEAVTVGLTGFKGEDLLDISILSVIMPSTNVQRIEDLTLIVGQMACLLAREYATGA